MPCKTLNGHLGIPSRVDSSGLLAAVWFTQDQVIAYDGDGSPAGRQTKANWGFGNLANDARRKNILFHVAKVSKFMPGAAFSLDIEKPWWINHGVSMPDADAIYAERLLIAKKFRNNQPKNNVRPVGMYGGLGGLDSSEQFGDAWKTKQRTYIELHDAVMAGNVDHVEPVFYFDATDDKATFVHAAWMLAELQDSWQSDQIVPWIWWRRPDGSPVPISNWQEMLALTSHLRWRWLFGHDLGRQPWEAADQERLDMLLAAG